MKATTEKAFELYIHDTLTHNQWRTGSLDAWDKHTALFKEYILAFIKTTQPLLWAKMAQHHQAHLPDKLFATLLKERDTKGTLHILRHGFKFYGHTFKLAYFKPAHNLLQETLDLYQQNLLHVTRQVPCHPRDTATIDLLLSLNGIPIATMELKNPATGQTWQDAITQYKTQRDPRAPLFLFKKGALVHFALDPDQIHMATRLNGDQTFFLPFNRGSAPGQILCGQGNPPHPSGHRTGYFWQDILQPDSFIDIIANFIILQEDEHILENASGVRQSIKKETLVFPRYHQLDAVRQLVATAQQEQAGHMYLVQHSAGSGKTNSISWLSHRLSGLHTLADQKVFDCVVVITDRRVLDQQLQDAIYQIEHAKGVVKCIDKSSHQLSQALIDGTQIVITTLQKFPFILKGLLRIAGSENPDNPDDESISKTQEWQAAIATRTYAIIVDEAHSSQSGDSAKELKRILGAGHEESTDPTIADWQDGLNTVLASRPRQKNLSFFAFTATPKGKTLELFGRVDASGLPAAFHTYSMKQAIEEGFILDVLQRYTTYTTYFKLVKTVVDDPTMPKKKARQQLGKFMALHPYNIEQKTEIIIEHFRAHVRHKLGGRAKAMVVTGSRLQAVRYMLSFQDYLKENGYTDIRPLVAFSGEVHDEESGEKYTEPKMNIDVVTGKGISEGQLPAKFDSSDYHVLIVANKYQTGFDQPLLCAMYVDKRLDGVQAVQTLSRLNRIYPGKELPFVLDFVNESDCIYLAFKPYYHVTTLTETSDPQRLEALKFELDSMHVYLDAEVLGFCQIFYLPQYKQKPSDHARMEQMIQPAVERFNALEEDKKEAFYEKLTAFTRLYAFLSQIIDYTDHELEILYSYGRHLLSRIFIGEDGITPHPEKKVDLEFYRIEKVMSGAITLEEGNPVGVTPPTETGTSQSVDEDKPLSEIILALNERFGTTFSEEERLFFAQVKEKAIKDERVIKTARANSLEKFELGINALISSIMMQRMAENDDIVTRYMDDPNFKNIVYPPLVKEIYQDIMQHPQ